MPLASGTPQPIFFNTNLRIEQFVQDAAAVSENCPLFQLKSKDELLEIISQNPFLGNCVELLKDVSTFDEFGENIVLNAGPITKTEVKQFDRIYRTTPSYWGPAIHLLRNHYLFRIFHDSKLVSSILAPENGNGEIELPLIVGFPFKHYVTRLYTGANLVLGPVVLENAWEQTGLFHKNCKESFISFNRTLERLRLADRSMVQQENSPSGWDDPVLYSPEQLFEAIVSRQKSSPVDLEKRLDKALYLISEAISCVKQVDMGSTLPIHLYVVLVAKLSAIYEFDNIFSLVQKGRSDVATEFKWPRETIDLKLVSGAGIQHRKLIFERVKSKITVSLTPDKSLNTKGMAENYYFSQSKDESFTNWNAGLYEAMIIVRNWLNRHFGSFHTYPNLIDQPVENLEEYGNKLSRFIAGVFRADECTIYQANYGEGVHGKSGPSLARIGGFIRRADESSRLKEMSNFMTKIAKLRSSRNQSISYSAFDRNETRYCRSQSFSDQREGFTQGLTGPSLSTIDSWGESGCSVPLRIQGIPWGVLELISDCPHHFSRLAQARISDFAKIISPYFFFEHVFRVFNDISNLNRREELPTEVKKQSTLEGLKTVFFTQSMLLCSVQYKNDTVCDYQELGRVGDWSIASREIEKRNLVNALDAFYKSPTEKWLSVFDIIDNSTDSINLRLSETVGDVVLGDRIMLLRVGKRNKSQRKPMASEVVLIIRIPEKLRITTEVADLYIFLMGHVEPLLDIFWNSKSREHAAMSFVSHQLGRTSSAVRANVGKLRDRLHAIQAFSDETKLKEQIEVSLDDLYFHQGRIEQFGKVLAPFYSDAQDRFSTDDIIVKKGLEGAEQQEFDLAEMYRSVFMGDSRSFSNRSILVDSFPNEQNLKIRSFAIVFRETLEILADNIQKYAQGNHKIQVNVSENRYNYFLTISNLGVELSEAEKVRIFREGYRGTLAKKKHPDLGQGLGLYWCQTMLKTIGSEIEYLERKPTRELEPTDDGMIVWHRFRILIPKEMCV